MHLSQIEAFRHLALFSVCLVLGNLDAPAAVTVQQPGDVVGTGETAWSYLVLEGEDYETKSNETEGVGFVRVDSGGAVKSFLGNPVLGPETTASKKGALWTQTPFAAHSDKVTYRVQFAKPGTYYLYMRFTMFENGGNEASYLNEDSFFVPPDFEKDPQTDWPLSDRGGYAEGCCDLGYLTIRDETGPVSHSAGDEAGRAFWEGNFHWNQLNSSQFLSPETQGEPGVHFKYVVTEESVGKPLHWTVSYREGGTTIDLWLFSTNPNLMTEYTQAQLDQLLLKSTEPKVTVQDPGNVVGSGTNAWSYLILEGEDFATKSNESPDVGFARVDNSASVTNFLGHPVLATNTTASGKAALWTQTIFSQHVDKVTYKVQFTRPGTYYAYMRFTMFENGGNETHYLNEDSFFLPPDFGKDPQTDWPLSDRGGYAEGCCDLGYLTILENGVPVNHSAGDEAGRAYWEGNFHWNQINSSQFLNPETQGVPGVHFKYEVPESLVGKTLDWTVSYREGGTTIDLWLFSTQPALMELYTQSQLDELLLGGAGQAPALAISRGNNQWILSWPAASSGYLLETAAEIPRGTWSSVADPVVVAGDRNTVSVAPTPLGAYFRLRKP
ncbi:MAG: hypothetical protein JNK85_01510 [Verrucomicrobiales bacterium]|nr:hypothetical protein [Verrucomicrobiales bacterium]